MSEIPLGKLNIFKTHYSIGKSIMTCDSGDKSVFEAAKKHGLEEVYILDESMSGFMEAYFTAEKYGIPLRYGVILTHSEDESNTSKFGAFALNTKGVQELGRLYTLQNTKEKKSLNSDEIRANWSENLWMAIPFYDSFIHENYLKGKTCIFDLTFEPIFFIEDHDLPFDHLIKKKVLELCEKENLKYIETHSIYYPDETYFDAWQTLRIINGRSYRGGTLDAPNIEGCGSKNFCF